nr:hypothetical protein [Fodinicola feengrottensis]
MTTFALGTAAGDMTATTLRLGYFSSGLLLPSSLRSPPSCTGVCGRTRFSRSGSLYIVTRPLGASFADWLGVSPSRGGLDCGTGVVSLALAVLIAVFVVRMTLVSRSSLRGPA